MQDSSRYIRRCRRTLSRWTRTIRGALSIRPGVSRHRIRRWRVGRWGERAATAHLRQRNVRIIANNWKSGGLEADIIAVERKTVVILEVKTRHISQRRHYPAIGAINRTKRQHLNTLAAAFMRNQGPLCRRIGAKHRRVDAVEVYYTRNHWGTLKLASIRWHRGLPSTTESS